MQQRGKYTKNIKELRIIKDKMTWSNLSSLMGVPEEDNRRNNREAILKKIMAENFPKIQEPK